MELQEKLKQEAIALGACKQGIDSWFNPNTGELCRMYFKYQDFCIEHNWPSVEQIKEFDRELVESNGIFVQGNSECKNIKDVAILGDAVVDVYVIDPSDITIRHKGIVNLHLEGDVLCTVSMHDDCRLNVVSKNQRSRLAVSYWSGIIENKELVDKIYTKTK